MPSPQNDNYTAPSGALLRAGIAVPSEAPSWVVETAWQWTDIPGTRWSDYVKDDGTGIAPQITITDPGPDRTYLSNWSYSGPVYVPSRHEFWMWGGGHSNTTINLLTRYNLGSDSPSIAMLCGPTSEAARRTRCLTNYTSYLALGPYFVDGKPYCPHSYYNNIYLAGLETFISFGLKYIASSEDGVSMSGGAQGYFAVPAFQRDASNWQPAGTYADIPASTDAEGGPRVAGADGVSVYWWHQSGGLRKFNAATNTHSTIGGTGTRPFDPGPCCNNGADVSLHIDRDSGAGWQVKTCDLATGVQSTIAVSGYALPAGYQCFGVAYSAARDRYYAVWVNSAAYNNFGATVGSVLVTELHLTSSTTATAALKTMTGSAPTKCGSYTGLGYDDLYDCLLVAMDSRIPVKAIKVA